jgi:lipoprotein-anchoring transpeptidase ErfK/SrfK
MSLRLAFASAGLLALAACGAPEPEAEQAQPTVPTAPSAAQPLLTSAQIEAALPAAAPATPTAPTADAAAPTPARPDPGLVRLQILLDRSPYSPGVIDGLAGENTRQAIAAYKKANDMNGDAADAALVQALAAADTAATMTTYTLTAADLAGPFSPPPGPDLKAQAAGGANYSTARERLAERFHVTEGLLQALNPGVDFRTAGQQLVVPAIDDRPLGQVTRVVIDKTERSARAYDAAGTLVAFYPATIGSTERPAPSGTLRVVGVAKNPDYTYDPDKLSYDRGDEKVVVPAGPNNPVGSVWIELNRDGYGIHGTPDPSRIAKTASNGCIRMTNWDAEQLAAAVKPGVEVRFI